MSERTNRCGSPSTWGSSGRLPPRPGDEPQDLIEHRPVLVAEPDRGRQQERRSRRPELVVEPVDLVAGGAPARLQVGLVADQLVHADPLEDEPDARIVRTGHALVRDRPIEPGGTGTHGDDRVGRSPAVPPRAPRLPGRRVDPLGRRHLEGPGRTPPADLDPMRFRGIRIERGDPEQAVARRGA